MKKFKISKKFSKELLAIIIIVLVMAALWLSLIGVYKKLNNNNNQLMDKQTTVDNKLEEKNKTIEKLTNQLNELKTKQEELTNKQTELEDKNNNLEEELEKVRISKAQQKSTVTSRSGTTNTRTNKSEEENNTNNASSASWIWANVTAYCPCSKCCGGYANGITAMGTTARANHTIAAPSNYAFGTKIEIQGMGVFTVEDRGGAITGNKIDVYFNSHSEALAFGRKQLQMRVVE